MSRGDSELKKQLEVGLIYYAQNIRPLPGIHHPARRTVFVKQMVESIHRIKYISILRNRPLSKRCIDPNDELFDPLKAAIIYYRLEKIDEAFWIVFLFVHFGKNPRGGWRYASEIYSGLTDAILWDWKNVSKNPIGFREWLDLHQKELKREGVPGGFGNHRKFQSLDAYKPNGTGAAVETYVKWVEPPRTHQQLFYQACKNAADDPNQAFYTLFNTMEAVASFGRLAKFDYLTMIGKLGFAPIDPGSPYLKDSTGPLKGAHLLFGNKYKTKLKVKDLDLWVVELGVQLNVGMQVLEDALCNWSKSPNEFLRYRG